MNNLLLLHGALGAKLQYKEIKEILRKSFSLYSINFSGHGGKLIPDEPFSIELFAEDVLKWMDLNNIDKIDIFGYSMGGYIALYIAKNHPKKIGKVFTLATKFEWNEEISSREVKMLDASKVKEKIPKFAEELALRHSPQSWEKVMAKTAEMMINLGKKNTLSIHDYSQIENEVMAAVGDRDKMVTIEETTAVYRKLKNGRLLVLPDTPHPLEQVNVERLVYEIKRFFDHTESL
jgi:pimeloyl-ACP methyl ester carboxylesterase